MARDLGYLAPGFPIAVASFTVLATGVAAGVGLAVVWIGLPILVVTLMTARAFGRLELRRVAARSGRREPTKRQRQTPSLRELGDSRGWFALLHGVAILPVRMITWTVPVVWIVAAGVGGTCPLWFWLVPRGQITLLHLFGVESRLLDFAVTTVIGWVFTVTAPFVVRAAAAAETGMARVLLASAGADHER
jgi:hypothetical protein